MCGTIVFAGTVFEVETSANPHDGEVGGFKACGGSGEGGPGWTLISGPVAREKRDRALGSADNIWKHLLCRCHVCSIRVLREPRNPAGWGCPDAVATEPWIERNERFIPFIRVAVFSSLAPTTVVGSLPTAVPSGTALGSVLAMSPLGSRCPFALTNVPHLLTRCCVWAVLRGLPGIFSKNKSNNAVDDPCSANLN